MNIVLDNIGKSYKAGKREVLALSGVSLNVGSGEFVSIIGPSGCGKSTLFKIICGLANPDRGSVRINGSRDYRPGDVLSYMPQKDLLMPWRTVLDNVLLPVKIRGEDLKKGREDALGLFPLFGLEGFESSYPGELSGGMSQRAALLRTVLAGRELMLLDEPFGSLDAITRFNMQQWLQEIWLKLNRTVIFITHDVDEAIFLSDRIYVMSPRPGSLRDCLEVTIPRPRTSSAVIGNNFVKLKEKLIGLLADQLPPSDS